MGEGVYRGVPKFKRGNWPRLCVI